MNILRIFARGVVVLVGFGGSLALLVFLGPWALFAWSDFAEPWDKIGFGISGLWCLAIVYWTGKEGVS